MIKIVMSLVILIMSVSSVVASSTPTYEDIFGYASLSYDSAVFDAKNRYESNPSEANKITYQSLLFLQSKRAQMNDVLSNSVIVYFYLPSCTHCEQFAPVVEDIKNKIGAQRIVAVNANESAYTQKFNISSAPTLVAFWKGSNSEKEEYMIIGGKESSTHFVLQSYKEFVYKILKSEFMTN